MQRILVALACAVLALAVGAQVRVSVDAPDSGHFWAVGTLPIDTAPVLVGVNGSRAYRLETLGEHSAIYGIESLGELVPSDGELQLVPAVETDGVPAWWSHPAVLDDLEALRGRVQVGGAAATDVRFEHLQQGQFRQRFQATHDAGEYWVRLWLDVFARSPIVHCSGFVARKDRGSVRRVPIEIEFGEPVAFPWERLHAGDLALERGGIRGAIDLEAGGLYPLRFSLLCSWKPAEVVQPDPPADLDDLTAAALEAGRTGQRWFVPLEWRGRWMGIEPRLGSAIGVDLAQHGLATFLRPHSMYDARPWASMPGANQGGAQNSLGPVWWLPAFVSAELRPADVHLWSAWDWALRPVHLLEPGTADPRGGFPAAITTIARQLGDVAELDGQVVPRYQTRGVIPVDLADGNVDFRTGHDEQLLADAPLLAAYAMTGDPVVRWLIDSNRALDLAQRRPRAGWRNNGRGEGRTIAAMLQAARFLSAGDRQRVLEHCLLRLEIAVREAETAGFDPAAVVRPVDLQYASNLACRLPATVPYEEAALAWAAWMLYEETGSALALEAAYRFGLAVAAYVYPVDGGAWSLPHAASMLDDGRAPTPQELADDSLVHRSSWPVWWGGCGLRAVLLAASEIGAYPESHRSILQMAESATEWLDDARPASTDLGHQALWGASAVVRERRN